MIAVVDLIAWAKENAWGRSATVPDGWIPSELLQNLVYEIKKVEPLNYNPKCKDEPQACGRCKWSQTVCRLGDSPPCHSYEPKTEPQTDCAWR